MSNFMDIISIVNALSTIALVCITFWYAYLTKRMVDVSSKSSLEQSRPYVVAHIFSEDEFLHFSIKNYGLRPALKVKVQITPDIDIITHKNDQGELNFDIKSLMYQEFIPPTFEIKNILYINHYYFERDDINEHVLQLK